ncbi:MAG TPA: site-specific integrase [Bacteroidia bacterium]|nr:site-specific integrase [Bacteroidia bacterium]
MEFNYIFDRKKKCTKKGVAGIIELRVYHNGKTKYCSTKIKVLPEFWKTTGDTRISNKHKDSEALNFSLDLLISELKKDYFYKSAKGLSYTFDDVDRIIKLKKKRTNSFTQFMLDEAAASLDLKIKTRIQHKNTINKLQEFAKKDVLFTDLNIDFIQRFLNSLREKGFKQNTIHKHHKNLKKFIDLAIKKELTDIKNPCREIKVKTEERILQVLTMEEVNKISELCFESYENKIEQARDMFLFACYTGLRISDVIGLKTDYIKKRDEGTYLEFYTKKVNKKATLPLYSLFTELNQLSKPEQLVEKYLKPQSEFLFPKLSEQYINRNLKYIAQKCGIELNLTFHIARETFATYMAHHLPAPVVKLLLQHSDIKTTQKYFHFNEKMVDDSLKKIKAWTI